MKNNMVNKHTKIQVDNWKLFEEQRLEGSYNMFDPRARECTGLDREEYMYCLKNYDSLKEQATK
jgi:hypothetical protein